MSYTREFIAALEFVWGEGFLSPGGPEEVRAILGTHDIRGKRILDVGSGLGGIDVLLAGTYGAGEVVGIDVTPEVVDLARGLAERSGLAGRVSFQLVKPGPLPFPDGSFDVVFSKDAMVHVADKQAIYAEILRVLKPGGWLLASDWLWAEGAATHPLVTAWVPGNPLAFVFTTPPEARAALQAAGFEDITLTDRHREIAAGNRADIARLEGPAMKDLAALVGEELAADRLRASRARQPVLDAAALIPTHIHGRRPPC